MNWLMYGEKLGAEGDTQGELNCIAEAVKMDSNRVDAWFGRAYFWVRNAHNDPGPAKERIIQSCEQVLIRTQTGREAEQCRKWLEQCGESLRAQSVTAAAVKTEKDHRLADPSTLRNGTFVVIAADSIRMKPHLNLGVGMIMEGLKEQQQKNGTRRGGYSGGRGEAKGGGKGGGKDGGRGGGKDGGRRSKKKKK